MVQKRILVVEDEGIVAVNTKLILLDEGYDVLPIAISASTAIDISDRERPDLVLMDIRLRGEQDGIEAAIVIWERFKIPAIFVTAYATDEIKERIDRTTHFGLLNKPVEDWQFKPAIEDALGNFYAKHKGR